MLCLDHQPLLWPLWLCHIFFNHLINGKISHLTNSEILSQMYVFMQSVTLVWFNQSEEYSQILVKTPNFKFKKKKVALQMQLKPAQKLHNVALVYNILPIETTGFIWNIFQFCKYSTTLTHDTNLRTFFYCSRIKENSPSYQRRLWF